MCCIPGRSSISWATVYAPGGGVHDGLRRRLALDVEVDETGPAAERLLLARRPLERWVSVLGAGLSRAKDELLRAVAVGVDVDEELKPRLVEA